MADRNKVLVLMHFFSTCAKSFLYCSLLFSLLSINDKHSVWRYVLCFFFSPLQQHPSDPPPGAWNKKQNKTLGVMHPSSGCNHRPYYTRCTSPPLIFNFILFPLYLRTPWNVILSAYNILSSPRPGVFFKKKKKGKRRCGLIDVRFNHRLANPGEWQTVKPIAVKAIYIPIVSLFWETIKKKKKRSWHGRGTTYQA